jgi:hypothetical protein
VRKFLLLLGSLLLSASLAAQSVSQADLPDNFEVKERVFSLTTSFTISAGSTTYGSVVESLLSLTRSFTYKNNSGAVVSTARERMFSWGTHIDVSDSSGKLIGGIEEQVMKSWFKTYTVYSVLTPPAKRSRLRKKSIGSAQASRSGITEA